jgi:hypothetical protein
MTRALPPCGAHTVETTLVQQSAKAYCGPNPPEWLRAFLVAACELAGLLSRRQT